MAQDISETTSAPPRTPGSQADEIEALVRTWWKDINADRGGRAELRRCKDPAEVLLNPHFHRLRRALSHTPLAFRTPAWIAAVARVLVEAKDDIHSGRSFGATMGRPEPESSKSPVSDTRFRRLLQVRTPEDLLDKGRAALQLARNQADIGSLGAELLWWNDRVRQQWAMDYYDAAPRKEKG